MIKQIEFKNYKAFEEGNLEIKPITILLGANSSGKSSLIQLLLMITQTLNYEGSYKSALMLNGDLVKLGEIENILHNKNKDTQIELKFAIKDFKLETLLNKFKSELCEMFYLLNKVNSFLENNRNNKKNSYKNRIDILEKFGNINADYYDLIN
ncbi:MAG: hypothetical protein H6Q16_1236 [Bacteroidetes bacterium]|nr:hypothetical protein [Bacteroidota bacterium]